LSVISFCYKVQLYENHGNHLSINVDFIRFVTWPGLQGYEEKDIKAEKLFMDLLFKTRITNQVL